MERIGFDNWDTGGGPALAPFTDRPKANLGATFAKVFAVVFAATVAVAQAPHLFNLHP